MPREHLHFKIVDSILPNKHSCLYQIYQTHNDYVKIGSLIHDFCYYYQFGKKRYQHFGEVLHGSGGEDTFAIIRYLLNKLTIPNSIKDVQDYRSKLIAVIMGMLSHIATDSVFHPLVFFETGNYYHNDYLQAVKAQNRHREFESSLDLWLLKQNLTEQINLSIFPKQVITEINLIVGGEFFDFSNWQESFGHFSIVQKLSTNKNFNRLIDGLRFIPIPLIELSSSLCVHFDRPYLSRFNEKFDYLHPVTGSKFASDVRSLMDESIELSMRYLEDLEKIIETYSLHLVDYKLHTSSTDLNFEDNHYLKNNGLRFLSSSGPSLNYGMPRVHVNEARYFFE